MDFKSMFTLITACVLLVVVLVFIIVLVVKNKWVKDIYSTVVTAIADAEKKFTDAGSGELKKQYVLAAVEKKCNELKLPVAILKLIVSKLIDTIVENYNVIAKRK